MPSRAEILAQHVSRVTAAVAFWIAAVLFVANLSLLSGWLSQPAAALPAPSFPPSTPSQTEAPILGAGETPPATLEPFVPAEGDGSAVVLDGGATVTFPGSSARTDEFVEMAGEEVVLALHTFTAADETTYSVAVIEYPEAVDLSDPAVNLLQSVSGAAGSAGGTVVEQEAKAVDGAPAIAFEIKTAAAHVQARNVLDGRRLYSQTVAYAGDVAPEDAAAFFDSFALSQD